MILDHLDQFSRYESVHPYLETLSETLSSIFSANSPSGSFQSRDGLAVIDLYVIKAGTIAELQQEKDQVLFLSVLDGSLSFQAVNEASIPVPLPITPLAEQHLSAGWFLLLFPGENVRALPATTNTRLLTIRFDYKQPAKKPSTLRKLRHQGSLELKTPRLLLRAYRVSDSQQVFDNWANDPQVTATLLWNPHPDAHYTQRLIGNWVQSYQSGQSYHWVITKDQIAIGDIALPNWSEDRMDGEIGYCLSKPYWNQGLMTEALVAVLHYLFKEIGFRRIIIRHEVSNPASGRVMQKAGLRFEGVQREAAPSSKKDGSFSDIAQYAALDHEWLKQQESRSD